MKANTTRFGELDINPVRILANGEILALDARMQVLEE